METIYDLSFTSNRGAEVDLEQYRGQPLLIVNTASKCGFTPQYDGLQALHEEYGDKGLVVIGFPATSSPTRSPAATRTSKSSAASTSESPSCSPPR